jgi:zinc transport system substrate-binding protein
MDSPGESSRDILASRDPAVRTAARLASVAALAVALAGCGISAGSGGGMIDVVGSFYPLAWAAERAGGDRVDVLDLTPPGVEAHDTTLSARQVADVQAADVVLVLGFVGFQPQVEAAAKQARGEVIDVTRGMRLRPGEPGLTADPHVWLDPVLMERIVDGVSAALAKADPPGRMTYRRRGGQLLRELEALDASYRSGLANCTFTTFVTTHEAFGYLAARYKLTQIGIEGLTPEAEPGAAQLRTAEDAITGGRAAPAVFYEGTDEGQRIGRSVAATVGVEPLPLGTLEFDPRPNDYLSVMRANLASLKEGLQCR